MISKSHMCLPSSLKGTLARAFRSLACAAVFANCLAAAENSLDLRPLVEALTAKRCAADRDYRSAGHIPCSKLPTGGNAEDPDRLLERIGETTKARIRALSLQARKEDGACSRGVVSAAAGGTSVGPSTPEQFARTILKAATEDVTSFNLPVGTMLSIPGVTQVQYEYKGLVNGPEVRTFRISGRVEGEVTGAKLRLRMDGDVEGDKNLYVEYMVNYRKSRSAFPAWSPFLEAPADIGYRPVREGLIALGVSAQFSQQGQQRNGVKAWHEYEYFWHADKIGGGTKDIVKTSSPDSEQYAQYPYGGDWVGVGWSSETRFKHTRKGFVAQFSPAAASTMKAEQGADGVIMSLNVKHHTVFYFHVDYDGNVSGRGVIVYTLDPNLCGVAVLTQQVNERVNFMQHLPGVFAAVKQLGELAARRFLREWTPAPPTIKERVNEALKKLPRIEAPAGEAAISELKAANRIRRKNGSTWSLLPDDPDTNYAFADIAVEGVPIERLWGISGAGKYQGVRGLGQRHAIAPPTPKNASGEYAGRFLVRHGRPGWYEDGKWYKSVRGGWDRAEIKKGKGGDWVASENDSELRILEHLLDKLPGGASGTINLYTQRPPCSSCAGIIEQFSAKFPQILIVVTSKGKG